MDVFNKIKINKKKNVAATAVASNRETKLMKRQEDSFFKCNQWPLLNECNHIKRFNLCSFFFYVIFILFALITEIRSALLTAWDWCTIHNLICLLGSTIIVVLKIDIMSWFMWLAFLLYWFLLQTAAAFSDWSAIKKRKEKIANENRDTDQSHAMA